jgi:hypothetical protein
MIESLEPIRNLFLFHYFDATAQALIEGQQLGNVLVLLAAAVVAFGLALLAFQRRSITVSAWPWQRGILPSGR